jgi:hypothetical protein
VKDEEYILVISEYIFTSEIYEVSVSVKEPEGQITESPIVIIGQVLVGRN